MSVHFQPPGHAVEIGSWTAGGYIHPKGAQPKRTVICPPNVKEPYLVPGQTYLFKTPKPSLNGQRVREHNVWSEVLAYRIGQLVGVDVPPCFIATDSKTEETGALMEFFLGRPKIFLWRPRKNEARLVHAADYMTRILQDKKRGRPHTVRMNLLLCRHLLVNFQTKSNTVDSQDLQKVIEWWGKTLTFDALIGNTDRHPDNWGFLFRKKGWFSIFLNRNSFAQRKGIELAPVFDNGTSLGYELLDEALPKHQNQDQLKKYISKGNHHCGFGEGRRIHPDRHVEFLGDGPENHMELCRKFFVKYPEAGAAMRSVLQFEQAQIDEIVNECVQFDVGIPFTAERARFVSALIEARKAELLKVLGG